MQQIFSGKGCLFSVVCFSLFIKETLYGVVQNIKRNIQMADIRLETVLMKYYSGKST